MARSERVAFVKGLPIPTIAVRLNARIYYLGADTGCSSIVLAPRVARELQLDVAQPERWDRLAGIGVSDPVPVVRLDRVSVGTSIAMGLSAHVYSLPSVLRVDGLLGLSFLSRFRATFEFDTGTLVLRQPPAR